MRKVSLLLGLMLFLAPLSAFAQQDARVTVQSHVEKVLKTLRNPALKGEKGERQKKEAIMSAAGQLFDFVELSKRTLGLAWNRLNMDQRKEFVKLYTQLLEQTYADRITAYTNEKIEFSNAVPLDANTAEVKSNVLTKTGNVALVFRLINEAGQWKVYDVVIEGVSLIENYRSQFREILANKDPEALLDTLRRRLKEGQ